MNHYVTLSFRLDEEVTPDLFAAKVAAACFEQYALRPGEAVLLPSDPTREYQASAHLRPELSHPGSDVPQNGDSS